MANPLRRVGLIPSIVTIGAAVVSGAGVLALPAGAVVVPTITTIAGNGTQGYSGDGGPAVKAALNLPTGVSEDVAGSLYIGDTFNNRVRKVKNPTTINADTISTIAGTGSAGFSGDGSPATAAKLNHPTGTAVDSHGNVFVADTFNNRVRKIDTTGKITTYAGNGQCDNQNNQGNQNQNQNYSMSSAGDGRPAVNGFLCGPTGLAVDPGGNLYVADSGHNAVRLVSTSGVISTYAGTGVAGNSGDGGLATSARLKAPTGVALNALNNLFIADTGNNRVRVVNTSHVINAFAGTGSGGYGGDGGPATAARLSAPSGLGVDPSGNVYVSDTGNQRVRQVNTGGTISTYAGNGTAGFSGDGGPATAAQLHFPTGAVAADGNAVYFCDTANQRVRGIFNGPPPVLPETTYTVLLPVVGGVVGSTALGVVVLRRRSARRAPAGVSH